MYLELFSVAKMQFTENSRPAYMLLGPDNWDVVKRATNQSTSRADDPIHSFVPIWVTKTPVAPALGSPQVLN